MLYEQKSRAEAQQGTTKLLKELKALKRVVLLAFLENWETPGLKIVSEVPPFATKEVCEHA